MPTFEQIQITTISDVDFEVYCGTCGEGLCSESSTRKSRSRGFAQVEVNACPECMKQKQDKIDELESELDERDKTIEELQFELEELKSRLLELNVNI